MTKKNLFVFAHPDDELVILGLISHLYQTEELSLLWISNGNSNTDVDRLVESRNALKLFDIEKCLEFWDYSQKSLDEYVIKGNHLIFSEIKNRLKTQIESCSPDNIFTCAYEGGNLLHDLLNFMVNQILKDINSSNSKKIDGNEFPAYHLEGSKLVFARFNEQALREHENYNDINSFELSEEIYQKKIEAAECYVSQTDFLSEARKIAGDETGKIEVYRIIPERNYAKKPKENVFYERRAEQRCAEGKYKTGIAFQDFLKIVDFLKANP